MHIGKANDTEVDFVVKTPQGDREYYQAAWTAREQSTFEREIRPFELIKDYNKKDGSDRILLKDVFGDIFNYKE